MSRGNLQRYAASLDNAKGHRRHTVHSFRFHKRRFIRVFPLLLFCGAGIIAVIVSIRIWDYSHARQEYAAFLPDNMTAAGSSDEEQPQTTEQTT